MAMVLPSKLLHTSPAPQNQIMPVRQTLAKTIPDGEIGKSRLVNCSIGRMLLIQNSNH